MKRKRLTPTLAALGLAIAGLALAAPPGQAHGRHGHHGPSSMAGLVGDPGFIVERMTRHLDLDEIQEAEISNILEAARPEFEALRERGSGNRDAMRELDPVAADYSAKLNDLALRNGQIVTDATLLFGRVRAEVHAVLTPEQLEELESLADRWQERREERRSRRQQ